jgi:hypothetical protein
LFVIQQTTDRDLQDYLLKNDKLQFIIQFHAQTKALQQYHAVFPINTENA